jgi:bifunctional non-homologous end joining protein LigD
MPTPRALRLKRIRPDILRGAAPRSVDPRQADLFRDRMLDRIEPCLPTLAQKIPAGPDWTCGMKRNGDRVMLHVADGKAKAITSRGQDWSKRYPAIIAAAERLPIEAAIIDGEAVGVSEHATSRLSSLQRAEGGHGDVGRAGEAIFYAWDLLYLNGHELRNTCLEERLLRLEALGGDIIRLNEEITGDAESLFERALELGLEGIIARRRDAPYRSGRSKSWLEIKCTQFANFGVLGVGIPAADGSGVGRLYVAARRGNKVVYAGSVRTGFNCRSIAELFEEMRLLRESGAPLSPRDRDGIPAEPVLLAEIEFNGWTSDGKLRRASFMGLREAADGAAIFDLEH